MKQLLTNFTISAMLGLVIFASTLLLSHHFVPTSQLGTARLELATLLEAHQSTSVVTNPTPDLTKPADDTLPPLTPDWMADHTTPLVISALNPGYTVNKVSDVDEFIELKNLSDEAIDLSDYTIAYTNSSGNTSTIIEFPTGSRLEGKTLLLRLARRAEPGSADLTYTTAIAFTAGPLALTYRGEVVDSVCWTGAEGCQDPFDGAEGKRTILVRDLEKGTFSHLKAYQSDFDPNHPNLVLPTTPEDPADDAETPAQTSPGSAQCYQLEFSEVFSYYGQSNTEQFIELYNPSDRNIELSGCSLRYKKKTYALSGLIAAGGYYTFSPATANLTLTKNPTTSNVIELIDDREQVVDFLQYNHGQKKQASYARFYDASGEENWFLTYRPTPGQENLYQEFRSCPEGKAINPLTGNCVKTTNTATAACPAGKYRNPVTGRCKNIATASTQKECAEGYERNPETNRCRKIKTTNEGAEYALLPTTYSDQKSFIGLWLVVALVAIGVIYIILQFRREVARAMRKARQRLYHLGKDLRSGKIIHRDRH